MTSGKTNLNEILKTLKPERHAGEFVFCSAKQIPVLNPADIVMTFREAEGTTLIIKKEVADVLQLPYPFVASWITLTVHSSLEAVGLTAAFAQALTAEGISCNVVAAFYHDHIFVPVRDGDRAMQVLHKLSL